MEGLNKNDKQALADRVTQEGWYAKSIAIMADLGQWDNYQLRYPIAHEQLIKQHANSIKPLPQWVMAIIKQESAWTKDAVSHANAHGLMVEVHHRPEEALSDGAQSLYPEQFDLLCRQVMAIFKLCGEDEPI